MQPVTAEQIRASFVNVSEEQLSRMTMPGLHEVLWDEREFLGWRDLRQSRRGYIVYWEGDTPVGITLTAADRWTPSRQTAMCSLCQSMQPAHQVSLFTAPKAGPAGEEGSTVGTYICDDLGCSLLIRIVPAASPMLPDPREQIRARADALLGRLSAFTGRVLA